MLSSNSVIRVGNKKVPFKFEGLSFTRLKKGFKLWDMVRGLRLGSFVWLEYDN